MYKKIFIIFGIVTVLSYALVAYLSKAIPYSDAEPILLYCGGISLLILFLSFISYSYVKGFLKWLLLVMGWILSIFYTFTVIDSMDSTYQIDNAGLIFIFVLLPLATAIIFLLISLVTFVIHYRNNNRKSDLVGVYLSLLPIVVLGMMLLVSIFN